MPEKRRRSVNPEQLEQIHDYWIDTRSREMWLHSIETYGSDHEDGVEPGVEYMMATRIIKNLHIFRKQSSKAKVIIHMHTCGGVVEEGFAIYDVIRLMPYPTTMISYTQASSMSSIILQAASVRLLLPSSHFMFHNGYTALIGNLNQVAGAAEFCRKMHERMLNIYAEKAYRAPKFPKWGRVKVRNYIEKAMNEQGDVHLTAEEAIHWGFADGILEKWPSVR